MLSLCRECAERNSHKCWVDRYGRNLKESSSHSKNQLTIHGLLFKFLGRDHVLASDGVERELHPAGNPELVIDIAQVVPNGVFGNANLLA
jgi:hypothetical protein